MGHCELIANCHNEKHKAKLILAQILLVGKVLGKKMEKQLPAQCVSLVLFSVLHTELIQ